jgi:hypothetical protein
MKNLVFVMHVKGDDGVQLLGDEEDATKLGALRTIVPRNGQIGRPLAVCRNLVVA